VSEPDEFPVEAPEDTKPKARGPAKGSPEAVAWANKMQEARRRKREERERSGAPSTNRDGSASKARSRSSRPPATTSELATIETSIVEGLTKLGSAVTPVAPIPGVYTIQTAEDIGGILTRLAAKNPAMLKALSGSSTVMDYVGLGVWGVGMVIAVQVQLGRIPADSPAAKNYGLTDIAVEFYGDRLYAEPEPVDVITPVQGSGSAFDPFAVPVPPDVAEAETRVPA
jgi:hypothetical protein